MQSHEAESSEPPGLDPSSLVTLAALASAVFMLLAAATDLATTAVDLPRDFAWPEPTITAIALGGGLAAGGVMVLAIATLAPFRAIAERLVPLADWEAMSLLHLTAVAAIASLGEEILFRGAMQPLLGLWATAIIFGLLHWSRPAHALLAVAAGLGLGVLYEHSGSLWPPMLAHFMVDLVTGVAAREALRRGWRP